MSESNGGPPVARPAMAFGGRHTLTLSPPDDHLKVTVRRPSLLALITAGHFPSDLALKVTEMQREGYVTATDKIRQDAESFARYAGVVEALIPHILVEPRIGPATEVSFDAEGRATGFVTLEDLSDAVKTTLFLFGIGFWFSDEEVAARQADQPRQEVTSQDVAPFRDGAAGPDAGLGGAAVPPAAVEPDRAAGG